MSNIKEFNSKLKNGDIEIVHKDCLCSSNNSKKVVNKDRYGLWHPVTICKDCGLLQSNPQLTDKEYSNFYSSDLYRKLYDGDNYAEVSINRYISTNQIFEMLDPIMKKNGFKKVIEFGCGGGWNLLPFQTNNYEVVGYDYSTDLIKLGKEKYNLDLKQGSFDEISKEHNYDVLILNHVIEHFTNIEENMNTLKKLLQPNGLIYVGIPNIDVIDRGQFQNAHTYYFTQRTFSHYMEKFGFEILEFGPDESIHMHGILKPTDKLKIYKTSNLDKEYSHMRKKLLIGVLKINIIKLLDSLNILSTLKKILGKFS
tara:strand:+ start:427 stop:1359 length:933 start_codon:yes stop_codon:yes gene_type:complete